MDETLVYFVEPCADAANASHEQLLLQTAEVIALTLEADEVDAIALIAEESSQKFGRGYRVNLESQIFAVNAPFEATRVSISTYLINSF